MHEQTNLHLTPFQQRISKRQLSLKKINEGFQCQEDAYILFHEFITSIMQIVKYIIFNY